jgi:hypothetical protein
MPVVYPGKRARITVKDETVDPPALDDPTSLTVRYGVEGDATPIVKTWPADGEIVHDGAGLFHIEIVCDAPGTWTVRAEASNGLVGVDEDSWYVRPSAFT